MVVKDCSFEWLSLSIEGKYLKYSFGQYYFLACLKSYLVMTMLRILQIFNLHQKSL